VASTDPGKSLQAIGEVAQPSLEELQQRVNQFIIDAKRRVIVLVDDVDRLEKQQVQAVFRLVKLTGNFSNTAYLLAFDEEMVARALGEIFSASPDAQADGRSFLEKIIQFPLRLPRARPDDLLAFCLARVREVLLENNLLLDPTAPQLLGRQPQADRFAQAFRQGVMPRLTTPRVAIRYANAISFSLPLLLGEVSPVDLLLVEALNCFYPEVYRYVAAHQDLFTSQNLRILRDLGGGRISMPSWRGPRWSVRRPSLHPGKSGSCPRPATRTISQARYSDHRVAGAGGQ
jgi:predicted KAP-like P-loop ATPase